MTLTTSNEKREFVKQSKPFFYVIPTGVKYAIHPHKPFALILEPNAPYPELINWEAFDDKDNDWDWYKDDLLFFNFLGRFVELKWKTSSIV